MHLGDPEELVCETRDPEELVCETPNLRALKKFNGREILRLTCRASTLSNSLLGRGCGRKDARFTQTWGILRAWILYRTRPLHHDEHGRFDQLRCVLLELGGAKVKFPADYGAKDSLKSYSIPATLHTYEYIYIYVRYMDNQTLNYSTKKPMGIKLQRSLFPCAVCQLVIPLHT